MRAASLITAFPCCLHKLSYSSQQHSIAQWMLNVMTLSYCLDDEEEARYSMLLLAQHALSDSVNPRHVWRSPMCSITSFRFGAYSRR